MPISDKLKGVKLPQKRKDPLWSGPDGKGPNGGITQSLLGRYLTCKERFRLLVVEGLTTADTFNHRLEYGNLWHVCEEAFAAEKADPTLSKKSIPALWQGKLKDYAQSLCRKYPTQQEQVDHWYRVCKVQFPYYISYWSKHPDVEDRIPLLQEEMFDVPYTLPSGRPVRLRGKWDSVDLAEHGKSGKVVLKENKTKGEINEREIVRNLSWDLQTMFYMIALEKACTDGTIGVAHARMCGYTIDEDSKEQMRLFHKTHPDIFRFQLVDVIYNVIRRPLSGGKGTIVRHKPTKSNPQGESKEEFYNRLGEYIAEAPETYFMRWKVGVLPSEIERFRRQCLDPMLEQLWDWWEWITATTDPFTPNRRPEQRKLDICSPHYRTPYFYNPIAEGNPTDMDEFLASGSTAGLRVSDNLFPELSNETEG